MNAQNYSILIGGHDPVFLPLADALGKTGYQVLRCDDGSQALQQALEAHPDLLVLDTGLQTIPAARLTQILRANPKSSEIPIFFVGAENEEVDGFQRHRDQFLTRPINFNQMLALINNHFSRVEHARQIGRQHQEVEGSLDQMALVDLLQVFGLNHKSGVLHLRRGTADRGAVYLDNGRIVNARCGRVEGEKAFNRLLAWTNGNFRFSPGQPQVEVRLNGPVDHLLMEGLRVADEMAAQAATLPALNARLSLRIPRERLPQGLRPATRDILLKLEYYPRVGDLLDQCPYSDFQILQVLRVLREKGVVAESQGDDLPSTLQLLTVAEILTARQALFGSGQLGGQAIARILVLTSNSEQGREFYDLMHGISEFEPAPTAPNGHAFTPTELGRLPLSETFSLRWVLLPAQPEVQPLWPVFSRHLFGVLSLVPAGEIPAAENYYASIGRPLAYLAPGAPLGQSFTLKKGERKGLSKLLTYFAAGFLDKPAQAEGT